MGVVTRLKAEVEDWKGALVAFHERMRPCFSGESTWWMAGRYMYGLMLPIERCNTWQMAEALGDESPYNLQQFLKVGKMDVEGVRDVVAAYVYEELGEEDGVFVVDESGQRKKGLMSAGVAPQYLGCTGQVENAQVAVFAAYVSSKGAALVDRALYIPEVWANDRERCRKAHIPDDVGFATKPELARRMVERALARNAPFRWVAGDEVYGRDSQLRAYLEERGVPYVLGAAGNQVVWRADRSERVDAVLKAVPPQAWHRHSAGEGVQGPRWFDWALMRLHGTPREGWHRWLLFRRNPVDGRTDYFLVAAPAGTTEAEMARVVGARWSIETDFQLAKNEVGLLDCEVRSWHGWYKHVTLAMEALAFLAATRHRVAPPEPPAQKGAIQAKEQGSPMADFLKKRGLSAAAFRKSATSSSPSSNEDAP